MKIFISVLCFLLLSSCGEVDFATEFSDLGSLRIVGAIASSAEVDGTSNGAESVTLTPYISDINAAGRVFTVSVTSCLAPDLAQGADPTCETRQVETYPNSNTFDTNTLSGSNFTGPMSPITISINNPAGLIAPYSAQQKFNGVSYIVIFVLTSGETKLTFVKEINITTRATRNSNPIVQDITFDKNPITNSPTIKGKLAVTFAAGGAMETYEEMDNSGTISTQTESYLITWFYSRGEVTPWRITEGQTSTYKPFDSSGITLIAVIKDRRGGTDIKILTP